MYLSKCAAFKSITEHQGRVIRSSGCGRHVTITALPEKHTDVANIANIGILSPPRLFSDLIFL